MNKISKEVREFVFAILYSLNLTHADIAELTGWSASTVMKSLRNRDFPDHSTSKYDRYEAVFQQYVLYAQERRLPDKHQLIFERLETWLDPEPFKAHMDRLRDFQRLQSRPHGKNSNSFYAKLAKKLTGKSFYIDPDYEDGERSLTWKFKSSFMEPDWELFIEAVHGGSIPVPRSRDETFHQINVFMSQSLSAENVFLTKHTEQCVDLLKNVVEDGFRRLQKRLLDKRGEKVVKLHLGFRDEELTFEQIGELLGVSTSRANQIFHATIDSLRKDKNLIGQLDVVVGMNAGNVACAPKEVVQLLNNPVDQMGLSPRLEKHLESAGIHTVLDLVSMSEGDILKTRNIGYKGKKEIKQKLEDRDLRLGMLG